MGFVSLMIWAISAVLLFCMFDVNQIQRAWDLRQCFTAHMQIDHRGGQFRMAHEHLDSRQIMTGFQKVGGKAVAQRVDTCPGFNFGFLSRFFVDVVYR